MRFKTLEGSSFLLCVCSVFQRCVGMAQLVALLDGKISTWLPSEHSFGRSVVLLSIKGADAIVIENIYKKKKNKL